MTKHIQDPREALYAESVCGELTGGTWAPHLADCARCIGLYEQDHGLIARPTREEGAR